MTKETSHKVHFDLMAMTKLSDRHITAVGEAIDAVHPDGSYHIMAFMLALHFTDIMIKIDPDERNFLVERLNRMMTKIGYRLSMVN
jgi:hypothetical protein